MTAFEKLLIRKEDDPQEEFRVQYNPERYSVEKSSVWQERGRRATLQYGGRSRKSVTFELFFNTYGTGQDVRVEHVQKLLSLMEPTVATSTGNKRPPVLLVSWGGFTFKCVLEKLSQNYTMFSESGVPVRAVVTATFKQFSTAKEEARNTPPGDPSKTYVVKEGETLSLIAFKEYGDAALWRIIAERNRLDDPSRLLPGQALTIPALL